MHFNRNSSYAGASWGLSLLFLEPILVPTQTWIGRWYSYFLPSVIHENLKHHGLPFPLLLSSTPTKKHSSFSRKCRYHILNYSNVQLVQLTRMFSNCVDQACSTGLSRVLVWSAHAAAFNRNEEWSSCHAAHVPSLLAGPLSVWHALWSAWTDANSSLLLFTCVGVPAFYFDTHRYSFYWETRSLLCRVCLFRIRLND